MFKRPSAVAETEAEVEATAAEVRTVLLALALALDEVPAFVALPLSVTFDPEDEATGAEGSFGLGCRRGC